MIFFGQIKQKASKCLKKNWLNICLTIFLVGIINVISQIAVSCLTAPTEEYIETVLAVNLENAILAENTILYEQTVNEMLHAYGAILLWNLVNIAVSIISFIFTLSVIKAYVYISKGQKYNLKNLDISAKTVKKSFVLEITKAFYIFLWSLLFIIPGIIKMFAYSQAYLIQLENPEKKAIDCLRESEEMMNGKKMEFFSFKVTFIGWYIITALIVTAIDVLLFDLFKVQSSLWLIILITVISYVVEIPVTAYMGVSDVFYYEALKEERRHPRQNPFMFYGPQGMQNGQGYSPSEPFENFGEEKNKGEEKDPFSDF